MSLLELVHYGLLVCLVCVWKPVTLVGDPAIDLWLLYHGVDVDPDLTAAPAQTTATTFTEALSAGATHHLVVRKRIKWGLISQNTAVEKIKILAGGAEEVVPPAGPDTVTLSEGDADGGNGVLIVEATYAYEVDPNEADQWLVYISAGASPADPDPLLDTPTVVTMAKTDGLAKLLNSSLAFAATSYTAKVLVRTRRASDLVDSENVYDGLQIAIDTAGPGAVTGGAYLAEIVKQGG